MPAGEGLDHAGIVGGLEQADQVRIRGAVVDQEAGIERLGTVRRIDDHGVGMSAETRFGLEQDHVMLLAEQIRANQSADAPADDQDVGRDVSLQCCVGGARRGGAPHRSGRPGVADQA